MSEPTRWLVGGAPAGARALLRAGLEESPSRQSMQRTLMAVSATALASTAMGGALGATAQAAGSSAFVFIAKCAAIGVASASVMLGAAVGVQRFRAESVPQSRAAVERRVGAKPAPNTALARRSSEENAIPLVSAASPTPTSAPPDSLTITSISTPRPRLTTPAEAPDPTQPELVLAEEIAFIDVARVRLRSGDPSGALQRVNEYDRRSDFGHFAPEALYLRIEAQLQLGNRYAAAIAAREMVARFPHAAQVRRATSILEALGEVTDF